MIENYEAKRNRLVALRTLINTEAAASRRTELMREFAELKKEIQPNLIDHLPGTDDRGV